MISQATLFDQIKNFKKLCQNPEDISKYFYIANKPQPTYVDITEQNIEFLNEENFPRFKNFRLNSLQKCIESFRFYISMIRSKGCKQFPIMLKILYNAQDQAKSNKTQLITKKIKQYLTLVQNIQIVQKNEKQFYFYKCFENNFQYKIFFQQIGNFTHMNRKAIMLDMALQLNSDFDDDLLQDMMQIIDFSY